MRASEYIAKLEALIDAHGDLDLEDSYGESMTEPEEVEGVFVAADTA